MSSKLEHGRENQKDLFSVWKHNVEKFYETFEKSIPQYHQSITGMYQEYVHAWRNVTDYIITAQREIATKSGIKSNLPEAALKVVNDASEEMTKGIEVQNKITIASIDATKQNIKSWNDNASNFANLNKNLADSWISTFQPQK